MTQQAITKEETIKREERTYLESEKLAVEINKFRAETRKLHAEAGKMKGEATLYPLAVGAGLITALVALLTLLRK